MSSKMVVSVSRCRLRAVRGQREGSAACLCAEPLPIEIMKGGAEGRMCSHHSLSVCHQSSALCHPSPQLLWPLSAPPLSSWSLSLPVTHYYKRTQICTQTESICFNTYAKITISLPSDTPLERNKSPGWALTPCFKDWRVRPGLVSRIVDDW